VDQAIEGGVDLELLEEAGDASAGGGPGEPDLVVDDDGGVDVGATRVLQMMSKSVSRGAAELQTGTLQ